VASSRCCGGRSQLALYFVYNDDNVPYCLDTEIEERAMEGTVVT
jgi:hypothetical protein